MSRGYFTWGVIDRWVHVRWVYVLEQRDLQIPVSIDNLCEYTSSVVVDHDFKGSRCWVKHIMRRHELSLRTSITQRLLADPEDKLSLFQEFVAKCRSDDKFELHDIINIDETPMYFDLIPQRTIDRVGNRTVQIRSTCSEKR